MRDYARLVFAMNELPPQFFSDAALAKRAAIIEFDQQVAPQAKDTDFAEKIIANELPGVLNWIIDGLTQLNAAGRLDAPACCVEAMDKIREENDPLAGWLGEKEYSVGNQDSIKIKDAYENFKEYCRENGKMPDMKVNFQLGSVHLTPLGGRCEVGEDAARLMGAPDAYFMEQPILLAKHGGQRLERAFFDKIVSTAVEKNRVFQYDANASKNAGATIAVVSWSALETCALYSPSFASPQGDFWEAERYHNGNIYPNRDGINVYAAYVKLMAGLLLANSKNYAVLRNVPLNTDTKEFPKKFADAMANVVDEANPHDGTTVIMPRAYKVRIASSVSHHGTGNALIQFDNQFNCRICGCEVVGSPNIPLNFRLKNEEE